MNTNRNLIKQIEETLKQRIASTKFRVACYESFLSLLESKVGTSPTKRELNKVVADVSAKTGCEVTGYVVESVSKDWNLYVPSSDYKNKLVCTFYSVCDYSSNSFTPNKLEDYKKQLENDRNYLELSKAQLFNASDIVDLLDSHDQQRAELESRLAKDIETFEAQCKVSLSGFDFVLKQAEELRENQAKEAIYKEREREFEARNNK